MSINPFRQRKRRFWGDSHGGWMPETDPEAWLRALGKSQREKEADDPVGRGSPGSDCRGLRGWGVRGANPGRQFRDGYTQLAGDFNATEMVEAHQFGMTVYKSRA